MLSEGADVNESQADGMTALHWAVYHDATDAAKRLLSAGAKANAKNSYGVTAISLAARNGNAGLVSALLEAGGDADAELTGGETVLMTAARTGLIEPVRLLIESGADPESRDRNGQSAIMWAASAGHAGVVQLLIESGADWERGLDSGFTPLFFAVREGRAEAVRVLLDAGADVNDSMRTRRTGGKRPRRGMSPLVLAVENGHFELAVMLVEAGADVNDQRSGYTALHTLSWVRKPDRGDNPSGDPSPIGSGDMTSLQFVRYLAEQGADMNLPLQRSPEMISRVSQKGATPFFLAAHTADAPLMRLLVELGADPTLTNAQGTTPAMVCAGVGTPAVGEIAGTEEEVLEAMAYLVSLDVDLDAVDSNGETAMHGAAYKNLPRVVEYLSESGADANVWNRANGFGWTPLMIGHGYRHGTNYKPDAATIKAVERVMQHAGIEIPVVPRRIAEDGYEG